MLMTKFGHSCVRLTKGEQKLVIDPGSFSEPRKALEGANAVLITHEHADHIDVDVLRAAAQLDPDLRIWAPESVNDTLSDLGERIAVAPMGTVFDALDFRVQTFGGQHAVIHPSLPVVANVAYLVEDLLYHPGDSFTVPPVEVKNLLIPVHAPWSKISEVIDFAISVRAAHAFQIHDGLLNSTGLDMVEGHVTRFSRPFGTDFQHLDVNESVELS